MTPDIDLELLRRFEPIIHFTQGEEFFPIDVARYVEACNLWIKRSNAAESQCLTPDQLVTLNTLAQPRADGFDSIYFLKFADPLTAAELATYKLHELTHADPAQAFHAGPGRLARVGYVSRFAHALFQLSLLARGRVPGDAAAAASIAYQTIQAKREEYRYCGRVVRENGWIVLQYWFLYAFNNWRSGFHGMNDHEADWEMICIYLSATADNGDVTPEWVAYASHDFEGDDLRRHWDDPELERNGDHPVIYAGAGSHASYFSGGEYLVEVEIPSLKPLRRVVDQTQKFWAEKLRQFADEPRTYEEIESPNFFRLPFVDYARGDGLSIGPGQEKRWTTPRLINQTLPWVSQYRGLWGRYISDPWAGENAPGGPMYNRDGSVRRAWYDPLGWAGLDKIPPHDQALRRVQEQHIQLAVRQAELLETIEEKSQQLMGVGIEAEAVQNRPHLKEVFEEEQKKIEVLSAEVDDLRAEFAQNRATLEAFQLYAEQLEQGHFGSNRSHIRRAATPIPESELQFGRLLEGWAAMSIGLMLISLVGLLFISPQNWFIGIISIIVLFIAIEAAFRRQLYKLITKVTIGLTVFAALVLIIDYFPLIAVVVALLAGGYMVWQNLRELRG
ncbi:MAG: hypothetical protein KDJ65_31005 [Anaerolineae bacterium]|nr:hypothetical protein [Anaerolineae bacterium]